MEKSKKKAKAYVQSIKANDFIKWNHPAGLRQGTVTKADTTGIYVTSTSGVQYHIRPEYYSRIIHPDNPDYSISIPHRMPRLW
jgi:hypothetical protein